MSVLATLVNLIAAQAPASPTVPIRSYVSFKAR